MVTSVVALLVCALSASLIPSVWADDCEGYTDQNGRYHTFQMCFLREFCCGSCNHRYCCDSRILKISEKEQERCPDWTNFQKNSKVIVIIASILGAVVPILICVGLIVCFVAPCCLLYKKCRKRRQQGHVVTTVVNTPLQPVTPQGYQPSYPGYQPVPMHPGPAGLHNPVALPPPPYVGPSGPTQPSYPSQPYGPPPSELSQPPYNPAYDPNS